MLELCMHIQHINNKSDLIRSLKFREKYSTLLPSNTLDTENIIKHSSTGCDHTYSTPGNTMLYTLSE